MFLSARHVATALALSLIAAPTWAEITVIDAYAIAATPMSVSGAAFMTIHNDGDTADRLLSVRSTVAARTELHTHQMTEDGLMQMTHVTEGFDLPAAGDILMDRGGHHVMFLGITTPFEDGLIIDMTLVFETAGEMTVQVPVDLSRLGGEMSGMDHDAAPDGE
jgi:periplasmic copper chaperone A